MNAVAQVLVEAKARIADPKNWVQGSAGDMDRCFCSLSSFGSAYVDQHKETEAAKKLLRKAIGEEFISHWNDAPERTHTEVMMAFDHAISLAECS